MKKAIIISVSLATLFLAGCTADGKINTSKLTPVNCVGVFDKTNEQLSFTAKDVNDRLYSPSKPIDSVDGWIEVKDIRGLLCQDVITANED
ncbi:hypothetical protein OSB94_11185 [Proteus vulgaris]|uniref:hypothetical protein n=1 Tax=Proteus TaxID=583 RepID=UPI000D68CCED|nr:MULTISPECIES: hypothetical protein [Proteus]MBQ0214661.1 hypothetical protein [Proteus vulgaris]MDS0788658.1 hypothetical protein [Proteus vulgaris]NBM56501.1 hypothetical protein [Proteus sp. G2669]UDN34254.1 hypothetical protein LG402_10785 [Proteus sp. NMG38-2]UPK79445.1 hypothetical protein LW139_11390 [Proteus vulgaris]